MCTAASFAVKTRGCGVASHDARKPNESERCVSRDISAGLVDVSLGTSRPGLVMCLSGHVDRCQCLFGHVGWWWPSASATSIEAMSVVSPIRGSRARERRDTLRGSADRSAPPRCALRPAWVRRSASPTAPALQRKPGRREPEGGPTESSASVVVREAPYHRTSAPCLSVGPPSGSRLRQGTRAAQPDPRRTCDAVRELEHQARRPDSLPCDTVRERQYEPANPANETTSSEPASAQVCATASISTLKLNGSRETSTQVRAGTLGPGKNLP